MVYVMTGFSQSTARDAIVPSEKVEQSIEPWIEWREGSSDFVADRDSVHGVALCVSLFKNEVQRPGDMEWQEAQREQESDSNDCFDGLAAPADIWCMLRLGDWGLIGGAFFIIMNLLHIWLRVQGLKDGSNHLRVTPRNDSKGNKEA